MWDEAEQTHLRSLTVDPNRHTREKLVLLVEHFRNSGTLFAVTEKGVPVRASKEFVRKIRRLTKEGELDWLLAADDLMARSLRGAGTKLPKIADALGPKIEEFPCAYVSWTNQTLREAAARHWSSGRPQQVGEEFTLDFGKEVLIRRIEFLQGRQQQRECPKQWKMLLTNNQGIFDEIVGDADWPDNFIKVELEKPVLIQTISVTILQPRLPTDHPPATCWAVDNIIIT